MGRHGELVQGAEPEDCGDDRCGDSGGRGARGSRGWRGYLTAAAITTSATVLFDGLDVAYGYKTWEEAGLDVGKSFLTSAVTSTIGLGFKAVGTAWSGASGRLAR